MRPHRARVSDAMLETLVYLKCNGNGVLAKTTTAVIASHTGAADYCGTRSG